MTVLRSPLFPPLRSALRSPLALRKGGGLLADALLRDYSAGFALSALDMSARVKGHSTNFRGNANGLLTYTSPSTKYVRNSAGVLVPGTSLRLDHDENGVPLGLLIEEQRTNIFTRSEFETGNVAGSSARGGLLTDTTFSGLKHGTGVAFGHDGSTASFLYKGSTVDGTQYTISAFVRMDDGAGPPVFGSASWANAANDFYFVLKNVPTSPSSIVVEDYGGGLYRVSQVITASGASSAVNNGIIKNFVNSARTFKVSGFQLEAAPFASSYIPTEASQVTRAADNITLATSLFPFNAVGGTIVAEAVMPQTLTAFGNWLAQLDAGTNTEQVGFISGVTSNTVQFLVNAGTQANIVAASGVTPGNIFKAAGAYKVDDFAASCNGASAVTDISGAVPTGVTTLRFGRRASGDRHWNGHLRSLTYIPERLSNALLEELSA